jgi:two-component system, LuxR family, response regulator DctR
MNGRNLAIAEPAPHAHIIDDDDALRDALSFLLQSRGVAVAPFGSAEAFLAHFDTRMRGCILTDVRMAGISGIELVDRLAALNCRLPVIVLTGHGNVAMAVHAFKNGVRDFIEKPFNTNALADKVIAAMADDRIAAEKQRERDEFEQKLAALSGREREVMCLLLAGKLNKVIADELDIAMRTVEVHRSRIFARLGVRSAVELANKFGRVNWGRPSEL